MEFNDKAVVDRRDAVLAVLKLGPLKEAIYILSTLLVVILRENMTVGGRKEVYELLRQQIDERNSDGNGE